METVSDVLKHCEWLISKGRGAEPGKLFMPKVEAQRRKANKECYRRVIFQTDEQLYRDWHTQKDRFVELCHGNPALAYGVMLQILSAVEDRTIKGLCDAGVAEKEFLHLSEDVT